MQYLTVETWAGRPGGHQRFYLASEEVSIGRDPDNDVVIDDPAISPRHARIIRTAGEWLLVDDGSANGVWMDGRSYATVALVHGSRFRIGTTTLQFHDTRTQKVIQQRADQLRSELSREVASEGSNQDAASGNPSQNAAPGNPSQSAASEEHGRAAVPDYAEYEATRPLPSRVPIGASSRPAASRRRTVVNLWNVLGAMAFLALVAGAVASIWEPLLLERIIDWAHSTHPRSGP